jgi:hypothetical protein
MHYKPKSIPALHIALGGLSAKMRVEADPATGVRGTNRISSASAIVPAVRHVYLPTEKRMRTFIGTRH